jgi:hypothetical protein
MAAIEPLNNELPAPGEPLRQRTHDENQRLLDADLARRLELTRSKLNRRQHRKLSKQYAEYHTLLNRARYNHLVKKRGELIKQLAQLRAAAAEKPSKKLVQQINEVKTQGRRIDAKLKHLQPTVEKFEAIQQRLEIHAQVLRIEREEAENRAAFFEESKVWEDQIYAVFRQSPRLHHITRDSRGREITRIPQIEQIILTPDKIYYRIKTSYQGLIDKYVGKWHFALPYGVDVADLIHEDTLKNLTAACRRVVTVERSETSQALFYVVHRLDSADGIPKTVHLSQVSDFYPMERHRFTPFAAGLGGDRKIVHLDLEQYPNALIAGAAGGGKSNLINATLSQMITMNTPDELRLILIDNKGGIELSHFDNIPHLLLPPVISIEGVVPALKAAREILQQRLALMQKIGARKITDYNKMVKNPLPRLVIVVDEMATLFGVEQTQAIHHELRIISSQGRAVGVHLIVCTQHPSVDILPGWIKTNLTLRISGKMPNHNASIIIVDSISAAHLPDIPGRMVFRRGGFEQILQTPLCDDKEIEKAVRIAREMPEAEWQIQRYGAGSAESVTIASVTEPERKFGRPEYLTAALNLGGSLSPRNIWNNGGKLHASFATLQMMFEDLIEDHKNGAPVVIDGVDFYIEKVHRGYFLKQRIDLQPDFQPPSDSVETSEAPEEPVTETEESTYEPA